MNKSIFLLPNFDPVTITLTKNTLNCEVLSAPDFIKPIPLKNISGSYLCKPDNGSFYENGVIIHILNWPIVKQHEEKHYFRRSVTDENGNFGALKTVFLNERKPTFLSLCICDEKKNYEENLTTTFAFQKQLLNFPRCKEDENRNVINVTDNRRVLIFVNPHAGQQLSVKYFWDIVTPIIYAAGMPFTVIFTEHGGQVIDSISRLPNLTQNFSTILAMSGDGLLFEIINGIFRHKMSLDIFKHTSVGILPCGSGNAFSTSLLHFCGEHASGNTQHHLQTATFLLTKHYLERPPMPVDLMLFETTRQRYISLLSMSWAIMADADIESEKYRFIGSIRFVLETLRRIVFIKNYPAKFSFLPAEEYDGPRGDLIGTKSTTDNSDAERDLESKLSTSLNEFSKRKCGCSPVSKIIPTNREQFSSFNDILSQEHVEKAGNNIKIENYTDSTFTMPKLSEPVPKDWVTLHANFFYFCVLNATNVGVDGRAAPDAKIDDGVLDIIFILMPLTRMAAFALCGGYPSGDYITHDNVYYVQAKAFRLEPDDVDDPNHGHLTIDGEDVEYGPIQGHVLPGAARIFGVYKEDSCKD